MLAMPAANLSRVSHSLQDRELQCVKADAITRFNVQQQVIETTRKRTSCDLKFYTSFPQLISVVAHVANLFRVTQCTALVEPRILDRVNLSRQHDCAISMSTRTRDHEKEDNNP